MALCAVALAISLDHAVELHRTCEGLFTACSTPAVESALFAAASGPLLFLVLYHGWKLSGGESA